MARRSRNASLAELIVRALVLLAFLAYAPVVTWWNSMPTVTRAILVIGLTLVILSSVGLLMLWSKYRKERRSEAWQRAMTTWKDNQATAVVAQRESARFFTDRELEKFAEQVYRKMGYKVKHTGQAGDHGVDVYLINPKQEIELVQCKQWRKQVGEPQVRDLYGAMMHVGAVRG